MDARAFLVASFAASWIGCVADEPTTVIEPSEFAEVCGSTEPVRLLQFEPWRKVVLAYQIGVVGERRLLSLKYDDSSVADRALMSVGLCGEAPRLLATGELNTWIVPGYDTPFVYDEHDGEVRAVDPSGERPPQLVFKVGAEPLYSQRTHAGLVYIRVQTEDDLIGSLVIQRWPDDVWAGPVEPEILLDAVQTFRGSSLQAPRDAMIADLYDVFVITEDAQLVRVDLEDGGVEVIATNVLMFKPGYEYLLPTWDVIVRHLLWQHVELGNDDIEAPEGEQILLDRSTGESFSLGKGALWAAKRPLNWSADGVLQLPAGEGEDLVSRLYSLPSLDYIEVPATTDLRCVLGDDSHAVVRVVEDGPEAILDLQTGEIDVLEGDPSVECWWDLGTITLLSGARTNEPFGDHALRVQSGTGPATLIANRATRNHYFLSDGRVLTGIGLDEDMIGDLIVVDPQTLEERLVASEVHTSWVRHADDGTLIYSDFDGDDAGVWLARLASRE